MSLRRNKAASSSQGDELIYGFADDFQHEEDPSVAESSVLSSIFPIVKPSQIRANAPRADMPSTNQKEGGRSSAKISIPKDMDSLTVDTGRPIDSVYIYPTEPQSNSLQRRTYKSGNRSVASAGSRGSGGGGGGGGAAGSVGGILDTLGLGGQNDDDGDDTQEGDVSTQRSSSSRPYQPRHVQSRRPNRTNSSEPGPQVHLRAFIVLFFLLSILYGAFQWVMMLQSNNKMISSKIRKARSKVRKKYKAFDEGEDRPLPALMREKMNGGDSTIIAKQLAVVPKKDSYKDKYSGSEGENAASEVKNTKQGGADKTDEEEEAIDNLDEISDKTSLKSKTVLKSKTEDEEPRSDDKTPTADKDDAPVDTLKKIDESDPDKGMSLSVQAGLSSIYSKDPTRKDTPFLWYIPRSGGGMVKNILSNCKDLVVASEVGRTKKADESDAPQKLEVISVHDHKYVNVDTTTLTGIAEAKALGLVGSGLAQLVVSPRLQAASGLFSTSHRGRTFAMIRHPIERAVSMFYFLKKHKIPALVDMSLEDYSKSSHVENNWMVRMLTDRMSGEVGEAEFELARQVLKEKVLVGLLEQKEESLRRFEFYFGWKYTENAQKQASCRTRFLVGDFRTNESAKGKVKEGSQEWSLLMWQNKFDLKLYKYATLLFLQQGTELFSDMP